MKLMINSTVCHKLTYTQYFFPSYILIIYSYTIHYLVLCFIYIQHFHDHVTKFKLYHMTGPHMSMTHTCIGIRQNIQIITHT